MKHTKEEVYEAMEVEMKPCLYLDSEQFDNIQSYKLGDEIELSSKAKVVSISQNQRHGKTISNISLELSDIKTK